MQAPSNLLEFPPFVTHIERRQIPPKKQVNGVDTVYFMVTDNGNVRCGQ